MEHGSWFSGKLYPLRSDLSPDGKWMIYLAVNANNAISWTGICKPPWLKTVVHWENIGSWHGGGWWLSDKTLVVNPGHAGAQMTAAIGPPRSKIPFKTELRPHPFGEDEGVLYFRLERDGFVYQGKKAPKNWKHAAWMFHIPTALDGWKWSFSKKHPDLWVFQNKYSELGRTFRFELSDQPKFLDGADWVTWDNLGQLIVARAGKVEVYDLRGLKTQKPRWSFDLDDLTPPTRNQQKSPDESLGIKRNTKRRKNT